MQQIQKEARLDELKEDWNWLQQFVVFGNFLTEQFF